MTNVTTLKNQFLNNEHDSTLTDLYYDDLEMIKYQKERYVNALDKYIELFGEENVDIYSAPGRTEVGGNHTDHQHGCVLAGSVNLDVISAARPNGTNTVRIQSRNYPLDVIELDSLEIREKEFDKAISLIRGVIKKFVDLGYDVKGFDAYTTSNVLKGSGLSSSAAFEVLVGTIINGLFANNEVNPIEIAKFGQFAENVYYNKPSGLMDQMASSVGGFVAIDFKNTQAPIIENIPVDFSSYGHALCIIDTKADHADLTDEYAAIPREMKAIAGYFSAECLREISRADVILNMGILRQKYGDRAVLRALHFFEENERVDKLAHSLRHQHFDDFLSSINESGNSSYKYLQNIFAVSDYTHQAVGIALNVAEHALARKGACRVHGGGFAGTIQAFVPQDILKSFIVDIEKVFGAGSCHVLSIRPVGGTEVQL